MNASPHTQFGVGDVWPNKVSMTELRFGATQVLGAVVYRGERIVLTSMNKPLAGIVPLEDLERLAKLDEQAQKDAAGTKAA